MNPALGREARTGLLLAAAVTAGALLWQPWSRPLVQLADSHVQHPASARPSTQVSRLSCEPLALTMPGFKRDAAAIMSLRRSMDILRGMGEAEFDQKLFERTDHDFHMLIARSCGNPFMSEALVTHHRRRRSSQPPVHVNAYRLMQSNGEHIQILEQVERGQFELAADLLRVHIQLSHVERPRLAGRGVPIAFRIAG